MAEPLGHYQEQRVGVFVDTQNLYHSARDYYERNVNFESLLRFAVGGRRLVRATAYVVEKEGDTSAWPFIYKLSTIGYKVRRMYLTVKETGEGGRPIYSGNWDMGIAADMVRLMPYLDVVVLGGRPIREPLAWAGPFVMNTKAEVLAAYEDYQRGRFGQIPG